MPNWLANQMGNRAGTKGSPGAGPELPWPQIQPEPQHSCQNTNLHPSPWVPQADRLGNGQHSGPSGQHCEPTGEHDRRDLPLRASLYLRRCPRGRQRCHCPPAGDPGPATARHGAGRGKQVGLHPETAGTLPRSHIQAGAALRLKPRPPLPGQGSLSLCPQLAESLLSPFLGLTAPGSGRCLGQRAGSWAQLNGEPPGSPRLAWRLHTEDTTLLPTHPPRPATGGEGRGGSSDRSESRWSRSRPQHKRRTDSEG